MSDQVRVLMWACSRTCGSSFLKCMNKFPDSQILFELFTTANIFGPDRDIGVATTFPREPDRVTDVDENGVLPVDAHSGFHSSVCTYEFAKKQMEAEYLGKKLIFAKDASACLIPRYNHLPKGYQHIFLIREPVAAFLSWKKVIQEVLKIRKGENVALDDLILDRQTPDIMPAGFGFKETYEMYQYVKENIDADPLIIDVDDLLNDPVAILSKLCQRLGLEYSDKVLSWEEGSDMVDNWVVSQRHKLIIQNTKVCEMFRASVGFNKSKTGEQSEKLSDDIQRCVTFCMPYFTKMYEQRLKI